MPEDNVRPMWSEDELDRALAALHAAGPPDEQALTHVRRALLTAAGAPEPAVPTRPRRRWAWWTAAAGTVLAVVAGVLVVQTVQFENTIPSADAVAQLNSAADRITSVDEPLGPGQYRYIATHAWWLASIDGKYAYLAENLLETWVPPDEKQDWLWRRDVTGARKWITGSEAEARNAGHPIDETGWPEGEWRAPCGDWFAQEEGREPCKTPGTWQTPNEEFMAALPRDPGRLYDRLRTDTRGHGPDENQEMLVYVADMLRSGLVPADLRAALYRVLAKVPGLQITEQMANLDGQKGTAYGVTAAGTRHDVIINPTTGQFMGEREITEDAMDDIPAGTVTEYTSVTTAVVNGIGAKP
ncbi:CU044_5270 family protein [Actinophytocola sp.]|uniref:CU044_5270 family protein n=1 Tax=Actinophytocola sp. TaxID=1872138 RepID=UPI00389A5141